MFFCIFQTSRSGNFCFRDVREVPGTPATSKIELFVTLVNDLQPLTKVTKNFILDVAGLVDTPINEAFFLEESLSSTR